MRLSLLFLLAACGDDGDCKPAAPVQIDNASCGDALRYTGQLVDWDDDTHFCGINAALFEEPGGAMDTTAPNGRFDMCIAGDRVERLDVTPPTGNSQCTAPPSDYTVPAIAIADPAVIKAGGFISFKLFTTAREASFFQQIGVAFDPTKAQVFVHVDGTATPVSISAAHGPVQAIADKDWAPGDTGHDVFFPNVDVGSGTTTVSTEACATGTGDIPLEAGKITMTSLLVK